MWEGIKDFFSHLLRVGVVVLLLLVIYPML